jgi:cellulose synthase/poly-beta-1,6-N-acetylglucosamine synthase-like glycosyltransferase
LATIFTIIILTYFILTLVFILAWESTPSFCPVEDTTDPVPVSVIVAVRNEESTITGLLDDLARQNYPADRFEVIIVDDHSTDTTAEIVRARIPGFPAPLRILALSHYLDAPLPQGNYKKKALETAVNEAQGELMLATDGDCRVGKNWVRTFARFQALTKAQFISGPLTFYGEQSAFERMQTVEFASLIGSGAATLLLGVPTMCNGANLAYTRTAFAEVGGYAGIDGTASGDDMFLLHKINAAYPGQVRFLKSPEAIVYTRAQATWEAFYQQRKRWASKWKLYSDWRVSFLAAFIFLANVSPVIALALVISGKYSMSAFLVQITVKLSIEFVFLTRLLHFLGKGKCVPWIIPLQFIYSLYVTFFGLAAQKKGYHWKGRKLQ